MEKISLCLTTYNRTDLLIKSFEEVYNDDRINEIIIVDDCSDIGIYESLCEVFSFYDKVKLFRNEKNIDCYKNKCKSVSLASNDFVILFDSDNSLGNDYLDKIGEQVWDENTCLMPEWAMPTFDYREFSGLTITKENVGQYMDRPLFSTALNCANYFVPRQLYLDCFDHNVEPNSSDSIFMNYQILKAGGQIKIVEGLRYSHLVHNESHYRHNCHKNPTFYTEIENKLRGMK